MSMDPFPKMEDFNKPKDPDSKNKFNKVYYGVIYGIIGPFLGFWIYYLMAFSERNSPGGFIQLFLNTSEIQSKILSLALIFNLAMFFVFLKFDFRSTALGILYATFVYVPVILYLKFF